jgi:transposase
VRPAVKEALPGAMIGLRLMVLSAWLHYAMGVSVNNLVKVLSVFLKFKISPGGLTQAWLNLAEILEPNYDSLGEEAANSAVLHADETGWRLNGVTHWLWAFDNNRLCYYVISPSRGSPVVEQVLGTFFQGVLITDFYAAYNKLVALAKQKCFFHLFTELIKVDKKNDSLAWYMFRKQLSRLLKDVIRLWNKRHELSAHVYQHRKELLYVRLDVLANSQAVDDDVQRLRKRLARHRDEILTFLDYESVSPYNNFAEQQMRPPVITRKISHQNRSERAAKAQAILMSLFQTAKLRKENPVESVLALAQQAVERKNADKEEHKKAA